MMYDPNKWTRPGYAKAAARASIERLLLALALGGLIALANWIFKP